MLRVVTFTRFQDLKEGLVREVGDLFQVSEPRLAQIKGAEIDIRKVEDLKVDEIKEILKIKKIDFKDTAKRDTLVKLLGE